MNTVNVNWTAVDKTEHYWYFYFFLKTKNRSRLILLGSLL